MKYFTFRLLSMRGTGSSYTFSPARHTCARGIPTVKKTAVLNTPTDMLWAVMYYDDLGRNIKTYAQHYLGGTSSLSTNNYDLINTTYNFTNAPTTVTRQHWNTTGTTYPLVTIANTYIYDQMGRKLKSWEQITNGNSAPTTKTLLSQTVYNEIGQVVTKKLQSTDSTNFYQNIAYAYNERGWLTTSTAPLFAMQLYYNMGTNKQYNGNIAYQYWGTPGNLNNNYTYTYDKLNRLTSGISADNYKETGITYDVMGNITALNRYQANTLIDQLSYTYANAGNPTNQLQSINDATTNAAGLKAGTSNFTYDGNGNLITDPTKGTSGITIAYNLLNLPQSITGSKTITYTYDATGNKLRRVSPITNNTDYINGIEYDGSTTQTLTFIQTEEGKAVPNGTNYDYQYYLGDNLGNTRNTFSTKTGIAVSTQLDDYYPFGMEISRNVLNPKNEYLYNKKELQEELGQYDYGARFYDPVIARWNTIDQLAEKYESYSPYAYVGNNPILRVDKDGKDWDIIINNNNHTITFKANFEAYGDNSASVQTAANAWNEQSGKFSYVIGEGKNAVSYNVNFDVSVNSDNDATSNSVQVLPDNDKMFARRTVTDENGTETYTDPKGASDGHSFAMKASNKNDTKKIEHEMGHNLGMAHTGAGLMSATASGNNLRKNNVIQALGKSGIGKGLKKEGKTGKMINKTIIGTTPEGFMNGKVKKNKDHVNIEFQ